MIKHIMFDLDGTLLAIGLDDLINTYMSLLAEKMAKLGYDPKQSVKAVWVGTEAMLKNNGEQTNREAFWQAFATMGLGDVSLIEQQVDVFYTNEFCQIQKVVRQQRNLKAMITALKEKGYTLSLATSPIFPFVGIQERLSWVGLTPDDFFLVTSYENSHYCKPNLKYYQEVMEKAGFTPEETMMVGNDLSDDMPVEALGVKTFLVTDILEHETPDYQQKYTHGAFTQLQEFLENLPNIKDE